MGQPVVFLSHASPDREAALSTAAVLVDAGLDAWLAPDDIVDGAVPWPMQVADAIASCNAVLVLLSNDANASDHVAREITLAVEEDKPVVPVRVRDVVPAGALRYLLAITQWIDAFPGRVADHAGRVVAGVRAALGQRPPESARIATHRMLQGTGVPMSLTSFVGRDQELADADKLLAGARLVTLTGPGGGGKTRLALELALRRQDAFRDGAAWVDLAAQPDPGLVASAVARALGITTQPGQAIADTLVEALSAAEALVVLDNCEHLLEATARLVEMLLSRCPGLQTLATSREPLRVPGEVVYSVPPLAVPDIAEDWTREEALRFDAVQLFVERAETADVTFRLGRDNLQPVLHICAQLDGIPLAIELAAARLTAMTAHEIAERLDDRFRLLTGGSRTAVPRHKTLGAAVDWSYDLLSLDERKLLNRLSVFAGSFDFAAVEAVAGSQGLTAESLFDLLASLASKSLVLVSRREERSRYRLLETIRIYAAERLESSEDAGRFRARHAAHFLNVAERASRVIDEASRALDEQAREKALELLETEDANVMAALGWAAKPDGHRHAAYRVAAALTHYWYYRSHWQEGYHQASALAPVDQGAPAELRASAHFAIGYMASFVGKLDEAERHLRLALEIAESESDATLIGRALRSLGRVAHMRGDPDAAPLQRRAADIAAETGDLWAEVAAVNSLGVIAQDAGRLDEAEPLFQRALDLAARMNDHRLMGLVTGNLGLLAVQRDRPEEARPLLAGALSMARLVGERSNAAWALGVLGYLAVRLGEPHRSIRLLCRALRMHHELGDSVEGVHVLPNLSLAFLEAGHPEAAAQLTGAGRAVSKALGIPYPEPIPGADEELAEVVEKLRAQLGEHQFERAHAEGMAMNLDQAVALALSVHPVG